MDTADKIRVQCPGCGKALRVGRHLAGKHGKCPGCGADIPVPSAEAPAGKAGPRRTGDHRKRAPHRAKRTTPAPLLWLLGGSAAVVGMAAVVVTGAILLRGGSRGKPPTISGRDAVPPVTDAVTPAVPGPKAGSGAPVAPPPTQPTEPATVRPPAPPLPAPDQRPQEVLARLVRFGRGTIETAAYAGRPLTGAIVEVEALFPRHTAVFRGASVTALGKDGKEVPACLLFIAGGRDGLAPTARVLADTAAPGWVFSVGGTRFDSPPKVLRAAPGVDVEVTAVQEMTVLVQGRPGSQAPRDVMAALPLHLKTGGIELTFLQNRKVSLAFVFPAAVDQLRGLKVLGQTLALDAARRDDTTPPAGGLPAAAPTAPAAPDIPVRSATTVFEIVPPTPKEFENVGTFGTRSSGGVSAVAFSPDGRLVLAAGGTVQTQSEPGRITFHTEGMLGAWNLQTGKQVPLWATKERIDFRGREANFTAAAFTADGRRVLTATAGGVVLGGEPGGSKKPRLVGEALGLLCFFPDGRRALLRSRESLLSGEKNVSLWDFNRQQEVRRYVGHTADVEWAAVLPDGRRFLSRATDGTVRLWAVGQARSLHRFDADRVDAAALAAKAPRALFLSSRSGARLWDLDKWEEVGRLAPRGLGYLPALTPDGRRALLASGLAPGVAAGQGGHGIQLWDLAAGRELVVFAGHTGRVECLAFSPDGRRFLSGSADGTMRLWDLPDEATLNRPAAAGPPAAR